VAHVEEEEKRTREGILRPKYETEEDRNREAVVLSSVCRSWECAAYKLPDRYEFDYLLMRKKEGKAWLEIKVRTNERDDYPDYMISFAKLLAARRLSEASGLPSFLLVQWLRRKGLIRLDNIKNFRLSMGGRSDRGDVQDLEPVIFIPMPDFAQLE